jgi:nucleotide-binding universal stress UspA family protein
MSRFKTIVTALDFSDSAPDALDAALALAAAEPESRLHLLHVLPDPVPRLWADELPPPDVPAVERAWFDGALAQLAALAVSRALDPGAVTMAVEMGTPAREIASYAERHGADVIVLGSHGHGAVHRFLLGSVADAMVRHGSCAVLIVPHRTLRETASAPAAQTSPAQTSPERP